MKIKINFKIEKINKKRVCDHNYNNQDEVDFCGKKNFLLPKDSIR